jgi:serine/threonine protein kinase
MPPKKKSNSKRSRKSKFYSFVRKPTHKACERCETSYTYRKKIGAGAFGSVHEACEKSSNKCGFVVKVQNVVFPVFRRQFITEAQIMKATRNMNIGPKYYDSWICNGRGFIIMSRWSGSAGHYFDSHGINPAEVDNCMRQLKVIVRKLNRRKIMHNDAHFGNVLYRKRLGKIQYGFADWGLSWDFKKHPHRPVGDSNRFRSFSGETPTRFDPVFSWWQMDHSTTREFGSRGRLVSRDVVAKYRARYLKSKRRRSLKPRSTTRKSKHPHIRKSTSKPKTRKRMSKSSKR